MAWPTDRKAVDKDGKWLNPWMGQLDKLSPLLDYTPAQFTALQQLIAAYIEAQGDNEEVDPGTVINLALPIDGEPLASEDFLISYKNSAQAGRRVAMSFFARAKVLISTTTLSGADTTIQIPAGYTDIELSIKGLSTTNSTTPALEYSEDNGGTFVNQPGAVTTSSLVARNSTSFPNMLPGAMSAADVMWAVDTVRSYSSNTTKLGILEGSYAGEYMFRGVNILSTAALNAARFSVPAGTFDGGTVELWGIP